MLGYSCVHHDYFMWCWDSNLGLYVCEASPLNSRGTCSPEPYSLSMNYMILLTCTQNCRTQTSRGYGGSSVYCWLLLSGHTGCTQSILGHTVIMPETGLQLPMQPTLRLSPGSSLCLVGRRFALCEVTSLGKMTFWSYSSLFPLGFKGLSYPSR